MKDDTPIIYWGTKTGLYIVKPKQINKKANKVTSKN